MLGGIKLQTKGGGGALVTYLDLSLWGRRGGGGGGGTPFNGLYGEASPKRGTFLRLQVYEKVRIL